MENSKGAAFEPFEKTDPLAGPWYDGLKMHRVYVDVLCRRLEAVVDEMSCYLLHTVCINDKDARKDALARYKRLETVVLNALKAAAEELKKQNKNQ